MAVTYRDGRGSFSCYGARIGTTSHRRWWWWWWWWWWWPGRLASASRSSCHSFELASLCLWVIVFGNQTFDTALSSAVFGQTRRHGNDARIAGLYLVRRLTDQKGATIAKEFGAVSMTAIFNGFDFAVDRLQHSLQRFLDEFIRCLLRPIFFCDSDFQYLAMSCDQSFQFTLFFRFGRWRCRSSLCRVGIAELSIGSLSRTAFSICCVNSPWNLVG